MRLTGQRSQQYDEWRRHDLSEKQYVYVWADGWFHKTGTVLNNMPKSVQLWAKALIHEISMAEIVECCIGTVLSGSLVPYGR